MKVEEEVQGREPQANKSLVLRVSQHDYQMEVLEKLGRLEAKMDMLAGGNQPGRMKLAEDRISILERSDIRRSVYDRIVSAGIAALVSVVIALHDHLGLR